MGLFRLENGRKWEENGKKMGKIFTSICLFQLFCEKENLAELKFTVSPSPVVGDDVYIHLVVVLSILGQVADGFAVGLLVAVDPVEPNLFLFHLLLQQRRLQGGLCIRDESGWGEGGQGRACDIAATGKIAHITLRSRAAAATGNMYSAKDKLEKGTLSHKVESMNMFKHV